MACKVVCHGITWVGHFVGSEKDYDVESGKFLRVGGATYARWKRKVRVKARVSCNAYSYSLIIWFW